jgi:serine/threonine-protein kinase
MTLQPGSKVGPYEIEHALGSGGMGDVYRARDSRLERSVAIKALPATFLGDAERLARFEREARLLAALNHPNIATIHGLETADGLPHLVLELIDGQTLSERLSAGPLPLKDVLDLGQQVAAAIEAAHDKGIVHRDLKPGNVMITRDQRVKVLDFGLARGDAARPTSTAELSASPTLAVGATAAGVILGTAPYMSPEQARGLEVDRRTDIWALGCLLFECLTGRSTFAGDTVSDVIARILEREPDWGLLPAGTPPRLRDLIKRCLTKDAAERPRDIGDLKRELGAIRVEISSVSGIRTPTEKPSLAVLYFENLSSDEESGYFCAGITEDILTDLSKIKGLKVASRNAVARYRGQNPDIAKVGADLGVKAVLEGSVRRAGDRVRISAQLINAADGFHLWAERFDRQMSDVFQVQEEIASAIAEALKVALTPAETEAIVQNRPNDVKAYDLYLKGRALYGQYTRESLHGALACFREAIALDPDYALAWAGMADAQAQLNAYGYAENPADALRLGQEAAAKAIALNPALAEGHKAMALVLRYLGDIEASEASLARAIAANPRYSPALVNLGVGCFERGDLAGAERCYRQVLELDPQEVFTMSWLAMIVSLEGRYDEAMELFARLRRTTDNPTYATVVHTGRLFVRLRQSDLSAAQAALAEAESAGCEPVNLRIMTAGVAAMAGQIDTARAMVHDLVETPGLLLYSGLILMSVLAVSGDWDAVNRLVNRKVWREQIPVLLRLTPNLQRLADQPAFAPRRSPLSLIWPLEAPMVPASVHALFAEVRIESGRPDESGPSSMRRN